MGQLVLQGMCFPHPDRDTLFLPDTSHPTRLSSSPWHTKQATRSSPLKASVAKTCREKPKNSLEIVEREKKKGALLLSKQQNQSSLGKNERGTGS